MKHREEKRLRRLVVTGLVLLLGASCGDANVVCPDGQLLMEDSYCAEPPLTCAEGTVEYDGECVSYDPNDTTAPSTTADPTGSIALTAPPVVTITADERATIYYTVDGSDPTTSSDSGPSPLSVFDVPPDSELKFRAVDLAGNEGEIGSELYGVDNQGPGPVTDLAATVQGGSIDVSWANPSDEDFAGVLVVRSVVSPTFQPVTAETYAPGTVAEAEDLLLFGEGTGLTDDSPFAGFDRYTVWTFDELGNFGEPNFVIPSEPIPVPDQTGTLSIDVSTGAVTVTEQPTSFTISGTSEVDLGSGEIDASITLQSAVGRPFFNTKLIVESVNEGATTGDGMLGGSPYVHYGVRAMATGESRTGAFTLTGITGTQDPVVLTVRIRDDPVIVHVTGQSVGGLGFADSSGVGASASVSCAPVAWEGSGFGGTRCNLRDAVFSDDGRFIYASNGWKTELAVIDSSTLAVVAGVDLHPNGGVGSTSSVHRSPDGKYIYALVTLNGHYRGGGSVQGQGGVRIVDLVKLEASTLIEVGRLTLMTPGQTGVAMRGLSMTADGTIAAAVSQSLSTVFFIDLQNMEILGQTSTSSVITSPSAIAIEPDGSHVWFGSRSNHNTLYRIDRATLMIDSVALPDSVSRPGQIAFGPDGVLYYGRKNPSTTTAGLTLVDTDSLTVMASLYDNVSIRGIGFSGDGQVAYLNGRDLAAGEAIVATFDATTHTPIDTMPAQGGSERSGHWLGVSPF